MMAPSIQGNDDGIMVMSNLPDAESAQALAHHLVESQLAACVNVLSPCLSVYRWQGKIETANEVPVLVKSVGRHYAALEKAIRDFHPYELPEIVCVPITAGSADYLAWLAKETAVR